MSHGSSWWAGGLGLRIGTLLFPPLGLVLLWRSPRRWTAKILGTVGILLFSLLYAAFIVWLLVRSDKVKVEWRGGYIPALTLHKTLPNYDAIDRHRAAQHTIGLPPGLPIETDHSIYWTGFRGPQRDGIYREQLISTNWPAAGPKLLWKQPCGGGYASFAVTRGMAFTIEQRREQEVVVAYDLANGNELWTHGWRAFFSESMGGDGPRSTPACDGERVYALGGLGELRCLEATTGKPVWALNILTETGAPQPTYGVAASPLLIGQKLIVLSAARRGKSVLCLDKNDGKVIWSALDDETGYSSPTEFSIDSQSQIIVCAETRTVGLESETGRLLWEYPWRVLNNQLPIAQPVWLAPNRFMLSAGYFTGCAGIELVRSNGAFAIRTVWKNKYLKNKFTSSVRWEGYIYGLDEDILTCLDAQTGERKWKGGRYGYGQLLLASGHLVILSGEGELALVKATPEQHQETFRFQAIKGKTWNHPAIAEGRLLVRNGAEMACFDVRP